MIQAPSPTSVALLLGLSFFLGLAFEDFFGRTNTRRPGGVRTFPMLALAGGALYLFDPAHFIPFTGGLLVLGAWLFVYYQKHVREPDEEGESNVGLVAPVLNVQAYLLGAITLAFPHWIAVATTVAAVLLLTGRAQLHALARRIELKEIITAGEFLILTGIILPLLPNEPVTTLTKITPRQVWLALVVVCTFSYVSYLAQRYWAAAARGLWMAALGGLYSSTADYGGARPPSKGRSYAQAPGASGHHARYRYHVLEDRCGCRDLQSDAGAALGAAAMRPRDSRICRSARCNIGGQRRPRRKQSRRLRYCLRTAQIRSSLARLRSLPFLFIAMSLASSFATTEFGTSGIYALAAIIGVSDIDPFVLNLAQGGTTGVTNTALAAAILIAASSNNVLKAFYAISFAGGRTTAGSAAALVFLAAAGVAIAVLVAFGMA